MPVKSFHNLCEEDYAIMCGITGIVDLNNYVRKNRKAFLELTDSLTTNGTSNVWFSTFVGFGSKYAGKDQRIMQTKANGDMYSIVFGGFLSDMGRVQSLLFEKGHSFQTPSEAEMVLHAFIEWREKCLEVLNGSFIFAIWDEAYQQLFITRSPSADEPVFYVHDSQFIIFGTKVDPIVNYLQEESNNIKELPQGQSLLFSEGHTKLRKY
jgi:asparagine synthase (glutamine-hydrolysing)